MTPAGFPHSDTPGSTLGCQLPRAYRRLLRPSSALDAKASTTCPSQLVTHTTNPHHPHQTNKQTGDARRQALHNTPQRNTHAHQPNQASTRNTTNKQQNKQQKQQTTHPHPTTTPATSHPQQATSNHHGDSTGTGEPSDARVH